MLSCKHGYMTIINDMKTHNTMRKKKTNQDGITLLITLLLMGVLMAVSTSLLNITLKQYQLSGISLASETAFQASSAGMECALYNDWVNNEFQIDTPRDSATCFNGVSTNDIGVDTNGNGTANSGEEQRFQFSWGSPEICTEISVYKFYDATTTVDVSVDGVLFRTNAVGASDPCPAGSVCTVIQSRGYNVACAQISSGKRVVEREYTQVY